MQTQNTKHKTWPLFILSSCIAMCISAILLYACKKETSSKENTISYHIPHQSEKDVKNGARVYSSPQYYQLEVKATGESFLNLITETPCTSPPASVTVTAINGSVGNNQIGSLYLPPTYLTGLAFDARSSKFYATNGTNQLIKFYLSDINDASYAPTTLTNLTGDTYLELYDIERDPQTGYYFAINRHPNTPYTSRLVVIDTFFNAHYVPVRSGTIYSGSNIVGLCIYQNGIFMMERSYNKFDLVSRTGYEIHNCVAGWGSYGSDEIGIHGDPITNQIVMANQKLGVGSSVINFMSFNGNPSSCPTIADYCEHLYPSTTGLKPFNTVDFSSTVNDDW